jgi:hypothetical protein
MRPSILSVALLGGALSALGCARAEPPGAQSAPSVTESRPRQAPPVRPAPGPGSAPLAPVQSSASAVADGSVDAAADATLSDGREGATDAQTGQEGDPSNRAKPEPNSPMLEVHARALLEAIAKDDPEFGRDFFFPRAPFKPLKDVADADRYWVQLMAAYKRDIHELHRKRRDWTDATFESFALGTEPGWVKPGDEYNKIGYYRTFRARLKYRCGDKSYSLQVQTIISWNKEWYVTHLLPIRH